MELQRYGPNASNNYVAPHSFGQLGAGLGRLERVVSDPIPLNLWGGDGPTSPDDFKEIERAKKTWPSKEDIEKWKERQYEKEMESDKWKKQYEHL